MNHGQLLPRSTKTSELQTRVDLLFKNVGLLHLLTLCKELVVNEVQAEQIDMEPVGGEVLSGRKTCQLVSDNFTGYVVAGTFLMHEDQSEYHDPSALTPL
ncbi:MAG: hypothetical protein ACYDB1_03725 [Acidiferrobacteraceae bacterium]